MKRFLFSLGLLLVLSSQAMAAFSVTESVPGFRLKYFLGEGGSHAVKMPGAASTAYGVGTVLNLSATLSTLAAVANASANVYGVLLETRTTPAAATATDDTRLYVETNLEDAVFEVNLDAASWLDDGHAALISTDGIDIAFTAGLSYANNAVDNSIRGHALVCYAGPGAGEWRYITAYDAAGGATGNQQVSVDRPFSNTITTSSYFIILGTGTDGQGVVPGGHADFGTTSPLDVLGNDVAGALVVHSIDRAYLGVIEVRITDTVWSAP